MSKLNPGPKLKTASLVAPTGSRGPFLVRLAACAAPLVMAAGCAAMPTLVTETSRPAPAMSSTSAPDGAASELADQTRRAPTTLSIPSAGTAQTARRPATAEEIAALVPDEPVNAALAPQSIPQFAATVFGGLLNLPYTLAGDVASRTDMVAGGSGGPISKRALFSLAQQALAQYGVEVYVEGGAVTVGSTAQSQIGATVERSRTPVAGGGRVIQFFTAQTIEVNALQTLLSDLFPNLGGARITPDPLSNSLLISGSAREVAQVVRTLREIDQPRFAGSEALRVEPVYWSAEALAQSLEQVLTAEGYVVSRQAQAGRAVVILPFPAANQVLVFTRDDALQARVRHWVQTLDQPAALGDKATTFVYQVRNTDAQSMVQLASGQTPTTTQPQPPVGVPGTAPATANTAQAGSGSANTSQGGGQGRYLNGSLLADPLGNRVIFTGTASEFAQLRSLLDILDISPAQVVIEVMIAEVTLTDNTALGVELFGASARGDGVWSGGTEDGLGLGGEGLVATFIGPEYRVALNAMASNNRLNILQRPQLVARSGDTARFQVGNDIPIITSQRATTTQTGNTDGTDILQSVQYRQTGVILELTPVVYGDRIDISINQEISEVGRSTNAAIASPPIINRSLTTRIAIEDGWTGVLGGLLANNYSTTNTGVPFLKDIPLVGQAFQSNSVTGVRTELLMLITPRILRGNEDMADLAETYSADMNAAFRTGAGWSYTLTPFTLGTRVRGVGLNLPSAQRGAGRAELEAAQEAQPEAEAQTEAP